IRGFRVEAGEIESALRKYPGVKEAAVTAHADPSGERRLVAYVVSPGGEIATEGLRAHLAEQLPEYMIPSAFVRLEKLPLSPNGKVDRKALAPPDFNATTDYVEPRTPAEELIAMIYGSVLKIERVGATADFFKLGGHSLLAMRVLAAVREALGVDVP